MQMPSEMDPHTGGIRPVLPYASAGTRGANRWAACSVLHPLLTGSLVAWTIAVNIHGLAFGSISRVETAAALFLAIIFSILAYCAEVVLLCLTAGRRLEPRRTGTVLALAAVPPVLWLLLARAQLDQLQTENALLLILLAWILITPLLVMRGRP
jgi:hypothetical protein